MRQLNKLMFLEVVVHSLSIRENSFGVEVSRLNDDGCDSPPAGQSASPTIFLSQQVDGRQASLCPAQVF